MFEFVLSILADLAPSPKPIDAFYDRSMIPVAVGVGVVVFGAVWFLLTRKK